MSRAPFGLVVHDDRVEIDVEGVARPQILAELHVAAAAIYESVVDAGLRDDFVHVSVIDMAGEPVLRFSPSGPEMAEQIADVLAGHARWPVRHEYRGADGYTGIDVVDNPEACPHEP